MEDRDLAVAQDKDTIAVWTMSTVSDAIDVAPEWEQTAAIKLAAGAKVNAPPLVAGAGSNAPAAPEPAAPATPSASAPLRATALDDALGAKGIASAKVERRADTPRSQWAAVRGKIDPTIGAVTSYSIWRVTSAGASTLELTLVVRGAVGHRRERRGRDGVDDAVITAKWSRQFTGRSKDGELRTTEDVEAIYVVGGAQLTIGAQHATAYKTETNLGGQENPQPEESISFTHAIRPGTPPILHVAVGDTVISSKRLKGLLDPRRDAWLMAAELQIAFRTTAR